MNVDNNTDVITFISSKCLGSADLGHRGVEWNIKASRELVALSIIAPTIYWTYFSGPNVIMVMQ
jgi:hypothetical protein